MQSFPVDIDPKQIVRWVMAERKSAPTSLKLVARCSTEVRNIPMRAKLRLGDEEREDLNEVATVATLEIAPARASERWLLTVVVEDEAGPRLPDRATRVEPEQQIDVGSFYDQFIRTGRGLATVTAEVENSAAETQVRRLLEAIETNRHSPRA
jgi:hypothetical protein